MSLHGPIVQRNFSIYFSLTNVDRRNIVPLNQGRNREPQSRPHSHSDLPGGQFRPRIPGVDGGVGKCVGHGGCHRFPGIRASGERKEPRRSVDDCRRRLVLAQNEPGGVRGRRNPHQRVSTRLERMDGGAKNRRKRIGSPKMETRSARPRSRPTARRNAGGHRSLSENLSPSRSWGRFRILRSLAAFNPCADGRR